MRDPQPVPLGAVARWSRVAAAIVALALVELLWFVLVASSGPASPRAMARVALESLPPAAAYLFALLAARFPARTLPLASTPAGRLLFAHGLAALTIAALWVSGVRWWIVWLRGRAGFAGAAPRFEENVAPLLLFATVGYVLAVTVHYLLAAARQASAAEAQAARALTLAREAELRALRSQLSPHFLFNSLNAVAALVKSDPEGARSLCQKLAEFLRLTLALGRREQVSLAEELALARHLVAIERVRFGERLLWRETLAGEIPAERLSVPPLILLPLVENAMKHGVAQRLPGGEVHLIVDRAGDRLTIRVENEVDVAGPARHGAGVGLANVRERLTRLYGDGGNLSVERSSGRFVAALTLPWREA